MPKIEPEDQTLKTLSGLHLWHAPMSSCSQRVRIALAETGQDYVSHPIDLERDEPATSAYQAMHSKELVPVHVHSQCIRAARSGHRAGEVDADCERFL